MNGDLHLEIEKRVAAKLKEETTHEKRHARQEVLSEVLIDKFDKVEDTVLEHTKSINYILGGAKVVGILGGAGLLAKLVIVLI